MDFLVWKADTLLHNNSFSWERGSPTALTLITRVGHLATRSCPGRGEGGCDVRIFQSMIVHSPCEADCYIPPNFSLKKIVTHFTSNYTPCICMLCID